MVRIFYGNRSFALLFLPLLVAGYTAMNLWMPYYVPDTETALGFWGKTTALPLWLSQLLAALLVLVNAILLNRLYNRNEFMERNNYLPSLLYITFASIFHAFYFLDGFGIAQTFCVLGLIEIFKLSQNEDGRRHVFNAAFLFGAAGTFFPVLLSVVPFLFWMIWVLRPFVMRESVLTVIGVVIPLVYGGIFASVYGINIKNEQLSSTSHAVRLEDIVVTTGFVILFIMFAMRTVFIKLNQSSIRLKKLFRLLVIFGSYVMLLAVLEYFVFNKLEELFMVFIPMMFILPYAFGYKKLRDETVITFYLFFLFSVGKFLYPLTF